MYRVSTWDMLGTAPKDKNHFLYPGTHILMGIPDKEWKPDILNWLDGYLGPVE